MKKEIETTNIVKKFFSAIENGEMPVAMELLSNKVEWKSPVTRNPSEDMSWAKARHGPAEVGQFFRELVEKVDLEAMEPLELLLRLTESLLKEKTRAP